MWQQNRNPCRWIQEYFGTSESPRCYDDVKFRKIFGVPKIVYRTILEGVEDKIRKGPDMCGRPSMPPDIQVLTMLRMGRTALPAEQTDDMCGYATSTVLQK